MRARVTYVVDWESTVAATQRGHIEIVPESGGLIEAVWGCTGGSGDGAELVSNSTDFDDDQVAQLVDQAELCHGNGVYDADLDYDEESDYWSVTNVAWLDPQPE